MLRVTRVHGFLIVQKSALEKNWFFFVLFFSFITWFFSYIYLSIENILEEANWRNLIGKVKNLFMLSLRISSYGCTREVWRARKMRESSSRRSREQL